METFLPLCASHLVSVKLTPYCKGSSHLQFELHSVVRIFNIDRYGQSLFVSLESFVDIVCESGCVLSGFSYSVPSLVLRMCVFPF